MNLATVSIHKVIGLCTLLTISACGANTSEGDEACALSVAYQAETYYAITNVEFSTGDRLGSTTVNSCDDSDGSEPRGDDLSVFKVKGLDPTLAIAVGDGTTELFTTKVGNNIPAEVQKFIDGQQ